jgi:hypothetical protein
MKQLDKIEEKIGDIIKENFPFYISYKLNKNTKFRQDYELVLKYYYMGEQITFVQSIPRYGLEEIEKSLEKMEFILDGFKNNLLDVRKDLISYPGNETQQEFLRKNRI